MGEMTFPFKSAAAKAGVPARDFRIFVDEGLVQSIVGRRRGLPAYYSYAEVSIANVTSRIIRSLPRLEVQKVADWMRSNPPAGADYLVIELSASGGTSCRYEMIDEDGCIAASDAMIALRLTGLAC